MNLILQKLLVFILLILLCSNVFAHKSSTAYLHIDATQTLIQIKADIAIRDVLNIIELDLDYDNNITWGELKAGQQAVFNYFMTHFEIQSNKVSCELTPKDYKIDQHSDGAYIVLYLQAKCKDQGSALLLNYSVFSDVDAQHRAMLKLVTPYGEQALAFSSGHAEIVLDFKQRDSFVTFTGYIEEGVIHIFRGFDHILFLLSLLLPLVLIRKAGSWYAVDHYQGMLVDVAKVVTAFTLAHSITFGIVLLKDISLQVNWVEGIIAFSVIIAALNNLIPVVSGKRWLIGFIFGLIHGLGFASVFVDSGLMIGSTIVSLLGFNLGVEVGQLLIVAAVLPVAYILRHGWLYQQVILKLGSISIMMMGVYWLVERTNMV